jgi:hypothetical protein
MVVGLAWMVRHLLSLASPPAFSLTGASASAPREKAPHLTILVSIDGFRADYLDRGDTPTLSGLAADGARGAMRPSFPSLTYPEPLHPGDRQAARPERHGQQHAWKTPPSRASASACPTRGGRRRRWWSQAKPIWVSAEQQGKHAAACSGRARKPRSRACGRPTGWSSTRS